MQFKDYVPLAVRTESTKNPFSQEFISSSGMNERMFHSIVGLATEVAEMLNATDTVNMLEECGDAYWYIAIYESTIPGTIEVTGGYEFPLEQSLDMVRKESDLMLDHVKKVMMYGKPFDHQMVNTSMNQLILGLNSLVRSCDGDIGEVWGTNIAKLQARYPEKFTEQNAEIRDLETERAILEDGLSK